MCVRAQYTKLQTVACILSLMETQRLSSDDDRCTTCYFCPVDMITAVTPPGKTWWRQWRVPPCVQLIITLGDLPGCYEIPATLFFPSSHAHGTQLIGIHVFFVLLKFSHVWRCWVTFTGKLIVSQMFKHFSVTYSLQRFTAVLRRVHDWLVLWITWNPLHISTYNIFNNNFNIIGLLLFILSTFNWYVPSATTNTLFTHLL